MYRWICLILTLLSSACASPSSQEAAKFGSTASDVLGTITNSRSAEIDLLRETGIERRACHYLSRGGEIGLDPPLEVRGSKLIADQIELLTAITDYAKALSVATDPQAISDLESAAAKFSPAVASLLTSPPSVGGSPLISPAINVISTVAVDIVELEMRARIRKVVEATRGPLDVAVLQLMEDSVKVKSILDTSYKRWTAAKKCNLAKIREMPTSPILYLYYKEADSSARDFKKRITILNPNTLAKALTELENTHSALLSSEVDFQAAYQKLKEIVSELQAVRSAMSPTSTTKASVQ